MPFFSWTRWLRSLFRRRTRMPQRRRPDRLRLCFESLEDRTLLSVLPVPQVSEQQQLPTNFLNPQANHPLIVAQIGMDPTNPQRLVAVASYNPPTPTATDLAGILLWRSTDGGVNWTGPGEVDNI